MPRGDPTDAQPMVWRREFRAAARTVPANAIEERMDSRHHLTWLGHGGLLLLLTALIVVVTVLYVSAEHAIYYWDDAQYQDITKVEAITLREAPPRSPRAALDLLRTVRESTAKDYSDLHTWLLAPWLLAFGASRLTYILGLALSYLLPFALAIGGVAAKLVPDRPRLAFWSTAFLMLCVPAVWLPTLHGYPDTGAAALIALAVLLYLHDPRLGRWWQIGAIGGSLALAVLLRRHFIYDGIAFFACITLQALVLPLLLPPPHRQVTLRDLLKRATRIGLVAFVTLAALVLLGWPFLERLLTTNFGTLYASFTQPVAVTFTFYRAYYGWLACLLAPLGLLLGLRARALATQVVQLVLLLGGFSVLQWLFTVKQLGFHYSLHFTPWVVLGLVALGWTLWTATTGRRRAVAIVLFSVYLPLNAALALAPGDLLGATPFASTSHLLSTTTRAGTESTPPLREIFSARFPPARREDYTEISRLTDYLRAQAGTTAPIYVAASSHILSDDLLWHANRDLHEDVMAYSSREFWQSRQLNVLHWVPFVDSNGHYPLEELLYSQYVVVATPFQSHLRPEEQDVLRVVDVIFQEHWAFADDFVTLPERFSLSEGVDVGVYRRVRPTSQAIAIQTLRAMQLFIGERPGAQLSWIGLNEMTDSYVHQTAATQYRLDTIFRPGPLPRSFLYLERLPARALVQGSLHVWEGRCGRVTLLLEMLDEQGLPVDTRKVTQSPEASLDFVVTIQTGSAAYLLLTLSGSGELPDAPGPCWAGVLGLVVSAP